MSGLAAGLLAFGASMVLVAPPAHADCPPLDLSCVTDTVTDTVQDPTDTVTDTVQDTTDTVTDTVQDVTGTVTDATGQVVDTAVGTVDTVVDATRTLDGTSGGGGSTNGRSGDPDASATSTVTNDDAAGIQGREAGAAVIASDGTSSEVTGATITEASLGDGTVSTASASTTADLVQDASSGGGVPELVPSDPREPTALATVAAIAFPFALLLLVGAFLLAQHRIDRRAPTLALAPLESDVAVFS